MPAFKKIDVPPTPYLYVTRITGLDPAEISAAMGTAFSQVFTFMQDHGIAPDGQPIAVYPDATEGQMDFRVGFTVKPDEMAKASGAVKADVTPGGTALHTTHIGPYAKLRETYDSMMTYLAAEGIPPQMPTWEVYVDDPGETPEDILRTEIYMVMK